MAYFFALLGAGAASAGREVLQSGQCGDKGQTCCCSPPPSFDAPLPPGTFCCNSKELWCHIFDIEDPSKQNSTPPSLCLPVPAGCGLPGAPCCPSPTVGGTPGPNVCTAPNTWCSVRGQALDFSPDAYGRYKANPDSVPSNTFGTCTSFPLELCGLAGGPCGSTGPTEGIACRSDKQACPSGYYCTSQLDNNGYFSNDYTTCLAVPPNCGVLGSKCCPAQVRQPPNVNEYGQLQPFCNDADVVCGSTSGGEESCQPLLKSPDECGGEGKPCCNGFHQSTDKPVPSICIDGAYCKFDARANTSTCIMNLPDCGLEGKPCCELSAPAVLSLLQGCKKLGLYCPFGENVEPVCQKCPEPPPEELTWACTHPLFIDASVTGRNNFTN